MYQRAYSNTPPALSGLGVLAPTPLQSAQAMLALAKLHKLAPATIQAYAARVAALQSAQPSLPAAAINVKPAAPKVIAPSAPPAAPAAAAPIARNVVATRSPVPVKTNLPAPTRSGAGFKSNLGGISGINYGSHRRLGALGVNAAVTGIAQSGASEAAAVMTAGTVAAPFSAGISLAAAAVVGLLAKMFGGGKLQCATTGGCGAVTQQQLSQASATMAQYQQIAGTVVGASLTPAQMQAIITASCVQAYSTAGNVGGCGNQSGIDYWWNYLNQNMAVFFQALASTPIGSTVTLRDNPAYMGHGKTNVNVTYQFANPGPNAPSATLGPLFAQYLYTVCTIFDPAGNCAAMHLRAPAPQMYVDFVDWYRKQNPQYAPAVPSTPIGAATTSLQPAAAGQAGQGGAAVATAAPLVGTAPAAAAAAALPPSTVTTASGQTIDVNGLLQSLLAQGQSQQQAYTSALSQLQGAGVAVTPAVQQQVATAAQQVNKAGFSGIELVVLVLIAIPLFFGFGGKKGSSSETQAAKSRVGA